MLRDPLLAPSRIGYGFHIRALIWNTVTFVNPIKVVMTFVRDSIPPSCTRADFERLLT
jgi:hypothetical protein